MVDVDLKKVLAELGETLGIGLAFDEAGSCMMTVDDETPVIIQANMERIIFDLIGDRAEYRKAGVALEAAVAHNQRRASSNLFVSSLGSEIQHNDVTLCGPVI